MKTKSKMARLLLVAVAALLILAIPTVETAKADQYVEDVRGFPDYYDPEDVKTGTYWEITSATGTVDEEEGECTCHADTEAWAIQGECAVAEASGSGVWIKDWTWSGPWCTAPGGILTWTHSAFGSVEVEGMTYPGDGGYALSVADADSNTFGDGSGTGCNLQANANGYVTDDNTADADASADWEPEEDGYSTEPHVVELTGHYKAYVEYWEIDSSGQDEIPDDTAYVYFAGGVICDGYSVAYGTGSSAWAETETAAEAESTTTAEFDW